MIALGTTDVAGRGTTAGFRLLIPLGTTADDRQAVLRIRFSVGWDYKKFYELDQFWQPADCANSNGGKATKVTGNTPSDCHFRCQLCDVRRRR